VTSDATAAVTSPVRDTPLRAVHERLGATMTSFAGWLMPLRYGSETAEHHAVRTDAALFDLSHMGEIAVTGPGAGEALDYAVCGWPSSLAVGRAVYTMLCAPDGGVLDDLIIYRRSATGFLVVANAANTAVVLAALRERCGGAEVTDLTAGTGLIALQGRSAPGLLSPLTSVDLGGLRYYAGAEGTVAGRQAWIARTGYTGEVGFEIFCASQDCAPVWAALSATRPGAGLPAAGLSVRDTLRLEAGMPLYGSELGPDITPYEAGLGRVVRLDKPGDFVGRAALAARAGVTPSRTLVGLTLASRRVPRHGYPVLSGSPSGSGPAGSGPAGSGPAEGDVVGVVTSGGPSPSVGAPIAMAYVAADAATGPFLIDIRGHAAPAAVTPLPFYDRRRPR
jgi:aminomethyltransferase